MVEVRWRMEVACRVSDARLSNGLLISDWPAFQGRTLVLKRDVSPEVEFDSVCCTSIHQKFVPGQSLSTHAHAAAVAVTFTPGLRLLLKTLL